MKIYIYQIWFPTSKKSYIGQTYDLQKRMKSHLVNKRKNLVGNALNKYNDWIIKRLHTCKTRDEANRIEIEEIRNFNCVAPNGYNLTRGGNDSNGFEGHHHSKEIKENQSRRMQGNQYTKDYKHTEKASKKMARFGNQNTKGKHWKLSDKTKNKMKGNQNAKGYHYTKETIEKIRSYQTTEETKAKMRQAHLGLKQSKDTVLKRLITQLNTKINKLASE